MPRLQLTLYAALFMINMLLRHLKIPPEPSLNLDYFSLFIRSSPTNKLSVQAE